MVFVLSGDRLGIYIYICGYIYVCVGVCVFVPYGWMDGWMLGVTCVCVVGAGLRGRCFERLIWLRVYEEEVGRGR